LKIDHLNFKNDKASVVELVDTLDSKSGFFGSSGSSPLTGTIFLIIKIKEIKKPANSGFFYLFNLTIFHHCQTSHIQVHDDRHSNLLTSAHCLARRSRAPKETG
jgi:hypothetical protein